MKSEEQRSQSGRKRSIEKDDKRFKKEEGIDWPVLKNRGKTMLIESLKKFIIFA